MSKIRKLQFWLNPTPLGEGPRWDADITREDGSRERITRVTEDKAIELLKSAMR